MLSERSHSNHIPFAIVLENDFPVSSLRVHDHLVHDALSWGVSKLLKVHIQYDILFLIVSHESEIKLELLGTGLGNGHFVRLLGLYLRGEHLISLGHSDQLHLSEEVEWLSVLVDTAKLDLGALLNEGDLDALLHLPLGNLVAELLHKPFHHVVALGVDDQGSEVIEWGLLEVANDEASSVLCASLRHSIRGAHPETGAHGEAKVSVLAILVSQLEDGRVQVLTEVDDGVLEMAIATWGLAHASSPMLVGALSISYAGVSHVLTATVLTNFQVCVAVEFGEVCCGDSTLSVQAVNVLAHDELEVVFLSELDEGHVCLGWVGLLNRGPYGLRVCSFLCSSSSCSCLLLLFLELPLVREALPGAWASLQDCVETGTVIGDSTCCRDASSCEGHKVLGSEDHLGKDVQLLVKFFRRVEVLLFLLFSLVCCICHFD